MSALGVCKRSIENISGVCQESDGNQIWRADSNSSPNWDPVSPSISVAGFNVSLSEVKWEPVRTQSEVSQESVSSQSEVSQVSVRRQSGVSGVCQKTISSLMVTKFGELKLGMSPN